MILRHQRLQIHDHRPRRIFLRSSISARFFEIIPDLETLWGFFSDWEVLPGNRKDFSSFKSLLVYTLGLRMQDRGVYKEGCSMKKVCASLFLIILLLAAIVPVSAAGTLR